MKSPLKTKRSDFSFKSCIDDPRAVHEAYDKRFGGNPFGIEPDIPKPITQSVARWSCEAKQCSQWRDENGVHYGKCAGFCGVG